MYIAMYRSVMQPSSSIHDLWMSFAGAEAEMAGENSSKAGEGEADKGGAGQVCCTLNGEVCTEDGSHS